MTASRHPSTTNLLRWFDYDHLQPGKPKQTSSLFHNLAYELVEYLPDGPELSAGLRKLLEAKDCAVRAALSDRKPVVR